MEKDFFSRELEIGITKESNFLVWQSPLVAIGKNINLKSVSVEF